MTQGDTLMAIYKLGRFFVSDIYAHYQDTYKGVLGKVQVEALDYLNIHGPTNNKELSERLNISKQHASKIMTKLEELGICERSSDPADGRSFLYSLTDEGMAYVQDHVMMSDEHLMEILSPLDEKDREDLIKAFADASRLLGLDSL